MDVPPDLTPATSDQRIAAESRGLPVAGSLSCWVALDDAGAELAYAVVLPEGGERRVRAVAASDPGSHAQTEAAVTAREQLIAGLADGRP